MMFSRFILFFFLMLPGVVWADHLKDCDTKDDSIINTLTGTESKYDICVRLAEQRYSQQLAASGGVDTSLASASGVVDEFRCAGDSYQSLRWPSRASRLADQDG